MKVTKIAAVCLSVLMLSGTLPSTVVNSGYAAMSTVRPAIEMDSDKVMEIGISYAKLKDHVEVRDARTTRGVIYIPTTVQGLSVTIVGERAFEGSEVEEVILTKAIEEIEDKAFTKCTKLQSVRICNPYCLIHEGGNTICSYQSSGDGGPVYYGVIEGYDNSTAQAYAEKYGYEFKSLGPIPDEWVVETTTTTAETTTETTTTTTEPVTTVTETTTTVTEPVTTTTTEEITTAVSTAPLTTESITETEAVTTTTSAPETTVTFTTTTEATTESTTASTTVTSNVSSSTTTVETTFIPVVSVRNVDGTTTQVRMNTYLLEAVTTTTSTVSYAPAEQGKPVFHLSHTEVCLNDALTNTQTVEIYVDGANQRYCNTLIYLYYDDRMQVGEACGGPAISKLTCGQGVGDTGDFITLVTAGRNNSGKDGLMWTVDFTLPKDCKVGDIFNFEIGPTKYGEKPLFMNIEYNDEGKAMTDYIFTKGVAVGSIRVVENPPYALGDVNNNRMIDSVDASMVLAEYAALSIGEPTTFEDSHQDVAADVNCDGVIDAVDASLILAYYAYVSGNNSPMALTQFIKKRNG